MASSLGAPEVGTHLQREILLLCFVVKLWPGSVLCSQWDACTEHRCSSRTETGLPSPARPSACRWCCPSSHTSRGWCSTPPALSDRTLGWGQHTESGQMCDSRCLSRRSSSVITSLWLWSVPGSQFSSDRSSEDGGSDGCEVEEQQQEGGQWGTPGGCWDQSFHHCTEARNQQ